VAKVASDSSRLFLGFGTQIISSTFSLRVWRLGGASRCTSIYNTSVSDWGEGQGSDKTQFKAKNPVRTGKLTVPEAAKGSRTERARNEGGAA
jgi:hypothetical protein